MRFKQYLTEVRIVRFVDIPKDERVSSTDLKQLEIVLDRLFSSLNIDIEFTKHFLDRVNDERNGKHITIKELQEIFNKTYQKCASSLSKMKNMEAVLHDVQSDINIPFVLKYNNGKIELISKTIMRKKNFRTPNRKCNV
jgi:hypothetical protein